MQILSNKGCYLKAPTLHRISKSLHLGLLLEGKQPREELDAQILSHAKAHVLRQQAGTGAAFSGQQCCAVLALGTQHRPGSCTPCPRGLVTLLLTP